MIIESLNHFKLITARQFFIDPADQNYILARWMIVNNFYPEYFWQALQAIEKYFKAGLVLQDHSVKKYKHDIENLYIDHLEVYGDLAFTKFNKPTQLPNEIWQDVEVSKYLNILNDIGNPDARYGLNSWYRCPDDIFKLDQICLSLRRLSIGLDWVVSEVRLNRTQSNEEKATYRNSIMQDALFEPLAPIKKLDKPLFDFGETQHDLLYNWNFEIPDNSKTNKKAPRSLYDIFSFQNSYLYLYWEQLSKIPELKKNRTKSQKLLIEGIHWLINHITISPEAKNKFKERLKELSM